ncbi:hypothetical protein B0H63DRAFT_561394 [Podospora didyma]|uniref:Heterokaryon incompatibility domain-containing protein n=1 Tax=Podospora didyma TaxID=330526 RepID=A0AAE0NHS0_9PEZI|nr:hypothetical protein B0H63DRAFT_561394 [Podospora didyma]
MWWLEWEWEEILPYDEQTLPAIYATANLEWFGRLWIVQEIQLANNRSVVQCGHDIMSLTDLRHATHYLNQGFKYKCPLDTEDDDAIARLTKPIMSRHFNIVSTQDVMGRQKCTNPCDKVYGALGLLSPEVANDIEPKYSLSVREVFRDAKLTFISHTERLELMRFCYQSGRQIDALSWVPDWTAMPPASRDPLRQFSAGFSRANAAWIAPDNILKVMRDVDSCTQEVFYPTGEVYTMDAFSNIIELGHTRSKYLRESECYKLDTQNSFTAQVPSTLSKINDNLCAPVGKRTEPFTDDPDLWCIVHCHNKAFIITEDEYFGFAPPDAEPGSEVVAFLGCDQPALILIGICYVYGYGDGIALLGPLPKPWRVVALLDSTDVYVFCFYNPETNIMTLEDPKSPPLSDEWERTDHERQDKDPETFDFFRNKNTGVVRNSDPRVLLDALKARGLPVTEISLI